MARVRVMTPRHAHRSSRTYGLTASASRYALIALALLVAGLVLVASRVEIAAPADAAVSARAAAACTKTREGQNLRVVMRFRYRDTLSRVDNGVFRQTVLRDVTRTFAVLRIRAATCKRPGGGWRVIDPLGVGYSSVGLNAIGEIRGKDVVRGWAVGIKSGAGGSIPRMNLQVMHCGKDNFFKTLKSLLDVPVPFLDDTIDAARWLYGKSLPDDKVVCGNVGTRTIRVVPRSDGTLRIAEVDDTINETKFVASPNGGWNSAKVYRVLPAVVQTG